MWFFLYFWVASRAIRKSHDCPVLVMQTQTERWLLNPDITIRKCEPTGIILSMGSANERRRYIVTSPLTGWAYTQNDPCTWCILFGICWKAQVKGIGIIFCCTPHRPVRRTVKPLIYFFLLSRTLMDNKIVDHSDVVGASPVGAPPTTSFSA